MMSRFLACSALSMSVFLAIARGQNADSTTVVTYNMALPANSTVTTFYQERREAQFSAIDDTGADSPWAIADVVCLQEAYLADDRAEIVRRASAVGYNYSYATTLEDDASLRGKPACSAGPAITAATCIFRNCPNGSDVFTTLECSLGICSSLVSALSQACLNCIGEGSGSLTAIVTACTQAKAEDFPSSLGLMLLSKKELYNSRLVAYRQTTSVFRRGYIRSEVKDVGTVFCTHMFPNFESVSSATLRALFERTNLEEMRIVVNAAANTRNAILAGDFNNGPAKPATNVTALFLSNYALAQASGFSDPYADRPTATCTFCTDNPINVAVFRGSGVLYNNEFLDHIFVKDAEFTVNAALTKRVFTEVVVPISSAMDVPLSDHYGVQVTLSRTSGAGGAAHVSAVLCYLLVSILVMGVL